MRLFIISGQVEKTRFLLFRHFAPKERNEDYRYFGARSKSRNFFSSFFFRYLVYKVSPQNNEKTQNCVFSSSPRNNEETKLISSYLLFVTKSKRRKDAILRLFVISSFRSEITKDEDNDISGSIISLFCVVLSLFRYFAVKRRRRKGEDYRYFGTKRRNNEMVQISLHIMASQCGQKSVFSNIWKWISNIWNSFSNIWKSFSNIWNSFSNI